jgi:hypothetical protein
MRLSREEYFARQEMILRKFPLQFHMADNNVSLQKKRIAILA